MSTNNSSSGADVRLKILFISYFFPPYNAIGAVRTGKLVERLLEVGYDVRVVSANKQELPPTLKINISDEVVSYTDWVDVNAPIVRILGKNTVNRIKCESAEPARAGAVVSRLMNLASKLYVSFSHIPDRFIGWYPFAKRACVSLIDGGWRPDVIYASAAPYTALMVAASVGKRYQIPWVGELRDLWTDNPYVYHGFLSKWMERRTLESAAALVTVSEPLAQILTNKYSCACHVVMNGFDAETFSAAKPYDRSFGLVNRRLRVVYTGQLYAGRRDPTAVFQALALDPLLKSRVEICFYGNNLDWVAGRAHDFGVRDVVHINGSVAYDEAINAQAQADVLLLLTWNDAREKGVLTGKLFEYIGAGRPILVVGHVDGDAASLVCKEDFGVASNEPAVIANFLNSLLLNDLEVKKYEKSFHDRANKYERKRQVDRLDNILRDVVCKYSIVKD